MIVRQNSPTFKSQKPTLHAKAYINLVIQIKPKLDLNYFKMYLVKSTLYSIKDPLSERKFTEDMFENRKVVGYSLHSNKGIFCFAR